MSKRIGLTLLAVASIAIGSTQLATAGARDLFPDSIALPNGFQPEGIAVGRGATIFAGSINTGAVYAASLVTGRGAIRVPAQAGRAAIGLSYDARTDILYVAGGPTGQGYAYNATTGATIAVYQFAAAGPDTFINDQIVTDDAVYFTDSRQPVLYKVALSRRARPATTFTSITLSGDYTNVPGAFNANGIVATPGGRSLIVVNSVQAALFKVDPDTGVAKTIDLGGAAATAGDGLLLRGDTLFVVQNQLNQVAVFDLDRRFESAELQATLTGDALDIPTTADSFLGRLYVVNARFGTPPTPDTTYTIERVRRSED